MVSGCTGGACPAGSSCQDLTSDGASVCMDSCDTDADCRLGYYCASGDFCFAGCGGAADCPGDLACIEGLCVEPACTGDDDCDPGLTCSDSGPFS